MEASFLSKDDLMDLAQTGDWPCASIYVPLERGSLQVKEPELKLRRLEKEAEAQLVAAGLTTAESRALLAPAQDAVFEGFRTSFGAKASSLAFFLSKAVKRVYLWPTPLPHRLLVNDHFEIRPLLNEALHQNGFYVLAISQNQAKLWHASRLELSPMPLPEGTPTSFAERLHYMTFSTNIAYRATGGPAAGRPVGKWYGTEARDGEDRLIDEYVTAVCRGVQKIMNAEPLPLILATVDDLRPKALSHLSILSVMAEGVEASPDSLTEGELLQRAWVAAEQRFARQRDEQVARYQNALGTKYTASVASDIMQAALTGQIEILLVAAAKMLFGRYDPLSGNLEIHRDKWAKDTELVSAATREALLHGAKVFVVDDKLFPDDCPMGAILRW